MFLPEQSRLLTLAVCGYVACIFLTTGALVAIAGLLLSVEGRIESAVLVPVGLFLLQVGMTAIQSATAGRVR